MLLFNETTLYFCKVVYFGTSKYIDGFEYFIYNFIRSCQFEYKDNKNLLLLILIILYVKVGTIAIMLCD